ncbi:MAG: type II secretion system minor pseudopilin GspH [Woeseiaceae bacterium]
MRPTARRRPSKLTSRGFTLIELLVVVVIIGIISSYLLLSFGLLGDDRALEQQARRLGTLIELGLDEATLQGRDFGIEFMRGGYRFVELDPLLGRWDEVAGDDLLSHRRLDEGMEFQLSVENRRVLLDDEPADTASDEAGRRGRTEQYAPHVLILSSGDVSPFDLRILRASDRASITLAVTAAGEIEIAADD